MNNNGKQTQIGESDVLVIGAGDVQSVLYGKEAAVIDVIRNAYQIHSCGKSSLPHSTFLLFPEHPGDRIIALPAYLGGNVNSAGLKWIASFPGNVENGMDRASGVLILNSMTSGRPKAILEGSIISAMRTAASAALAAHLLQGQPAMAAGLIGCGPIQFQIARFLVSVCPGLREFVLFDLSPERVQIFAERCKASFPQMAVHIVDDLKTVFSSTGLLSFATTAARPHVSDLSACAPGTVILHISLRDLSPEIILASDNVVDDVSHVCRAQTSVHLAEQRTASTKFIRCTLSDILNGAASPKRDASAITVFSPFGLGILDVALGEFALSEALAQGRGSVIPDLLPDSWSHMTMPAHT